MSEGAEVGMKEKAEEFVATGGRYIVEALRIRGLFL